MFKSGLLFGLFSDNFLSLIFGVSNHQFREFKAFIQLYLNSNFALTLHVGYLNPAYLEQPSHVNFNVFVA